MVSHPIERVRPDALFVINQLTDTGRVVQICRNRSLRRILLLSSHRLFPHEQSEWVDQLAPCVADFITFGDVLDDSRSATIDDETTRKLLARRIPPARYVRIFQEEMTYRKNAAIHRSLTSDLSGVSIYADSGLGLSGSYWRQTGAFPVTRFPFRTRWRTSSWHRSIEQWRLERRLPRMGYIVEDAGTRYLFICSLRRLQLSHELKTDEVRINGHHIDGADFVAATIHDYVPAIHKLGRPVRIFGDGYLPANYTRSYLDGYGPAEFVVSDPFSAQWLRAHGRTVVSIPSLWHSLPWPPLHTAPCVRTVVCLLNHTGDWSALINRSDTDSLALAFVQLAHRFPEISFVLRPHPGMELAEHEGTGSMYRIAKLVSAVDRPNLSTSATPLEDDLERGDLFISEYSATLLEAWKRGKAGIIVNLTGRRSLMDDFARLGFDQTDSLDTLARLVSATIANPDAFKVRHDAAVSRYNILLAAHLKP